uniref:Homing endonuclease LAGLIDADG domain-containing protein n=1 Tax=Morchella brunnea TaxID=1174671 RepID=A0A8K1MHE1_9PEZI|nr:hypothetical protein LK370_mgp035 [Morchella brunnea]UBU98595.1 hypothetical protein [Morchella brunnea]
MRIVQRFALSQKDAELEFLFLSKLVQGNLEKCKGFDRIIVNYSNLDIIINYLNTHNLHSIKAKSLEKWLQIYEYRKNKPAKPLQGLCISPLEDASEKVDYKQMKKDASLINQRPPA